MLPLYFLKELRIFNASEHTMCECVRVCARVCHGQSVTHPKGFHLYFDSWYRTSQWDTGRSEPGWTPGLIHQRPLHQDQSSGPEPRPNRVTLWIRQISIPHVPMSWRSIFLSFRISLYYICMLTHIDAKPWLINILRISIFVFSPCLSEGDS